MQANKIALIDSPIFRENFSENVILKTVPLIREVRLNPEENLFSQGDFDECCIYFVEKGLLEICSYYAHPYVRKQKSTNKLV
jgi:hypothetical protein